MSSSSTFHVVCFLYSRILFRVRHTFSSKCECGFCGHKLSRRSRHQSTTVTKPVWQCMNATKNGIASCPNCKSIDERVLEGAFLDVFHQLAENFDDVLESVLATVETVIRDDADLKRVKQIDREISLIESRKSKLTDLLIDGTITKEDYDVKLTELTRKLNKYTGEKNYLSQGVDWQKSISKRMQELRQTLETQEPLDVFDRIVFESIVEKVIVGGYDSNGNPAPYNLTFVLKSDQSISTEYNRERYMAKQKETREGRVS